MLSARILQMERQIQRDEHLEEEIVNADEVGRTN